MEGAHRLQPDTGNLGCRTSEGPYGCLLGDPCPGTAPTASPDYRPRGDVGGLPVFSDGAPTGALGPADGDEGRPGHEYRVPMISNWAQPLIRARFEPALRAVTAC